MEKSAGWCGQYCPEHSRINENVLEVKNKVSMKIFVVSITIIGAVFSGLFASYIALGKDITKIEVNTARIKEVQIIVQDTLKELKRGQERHLDKQHRRGVYVPTPDIDTLSD